MISFAPITFLLTSWACWLLKSSSRRASETRKRASAAPCGSRSANRSLACPFLCSSNAQACDVCMCRQSFIITSSGYTRDKMVLCCHHHQDGLHRIHHGVERFFWPNSRYKIYIYRTNTPPAYANIQNASKFSNKSCHLHMFLPAQRASAEPAPTAGAGVGLSVAATLELPCPVSLLGKHESGNTYGMVMRPLYHTTRKEFLHGLR